MRRIPNRAIFPAFPTLPVAALALLLAACASQSAAPTAAAPHFDGVYRLTYGHTGSTLYFRFLPTGVVLVARSDAAAAEVRTALETGDYGGIEVNIGNWYLEGSLLQVGVTEGTFSYDSRFDLQADGGIALHGLDSRFDFLPATGAAVDISTR